MQTQLFVTDNGDPSVGIFPMTWVVDCPVYVKDIHDRTEEEQENLNYFRISTVKLFKDFADGLVTADYDFENIPDDDDETF